MNRLFDYIYYRMTQFYFKWDGRDGITAIMGVSMIQCMIIADVLVFMLSIVFGRDMTALYSKAIGIGGVVILLILVIYNYFKYRGRFDHLEGYWANESAEARLLRGMGVLLCLIIPWVPMILMAVYW